MKVTEKKLAANRRNAKRSTGPRTARGKNTSRFNAVTTGLFAKHVVIPEKYDIDGSVGDGISPQEQFHELLEALEQEYHPEGPSEIYWVTNMAECMWKQRRISRSESRLVQLRATPQRQETERLRARMFDNDMATLNMALEEIKTTQTLSEATLKHIGCWPEIAISLLTYGLDPKELTASIVRTIAFLQSTDWSSTVNQSLEPFGAPPAIPSESDMEQILRYEKALQGRHDWALQRLLESQARRQRTRQGSRPPAKILSFK